MNQRMQGIIRFVIGIIVCEGAGIIGSIFTTSAIPTWYATLKKPVFSPPNWLFAPVWGILYLLMGVSAAIIWQRGLSEPPVRKALIIFIIQLALNILWSAAFFGLRSPLAGMIVIVALWVAILFTILSFFRISSFAAFLLVPYILWVSFATILNFTIWQLNP
ncbi:MAG: TspO/MBR family protein [Chloroflexota bacterium]